MDEMQRPIGVFDSGVGGISVLRELVALMPNENFIFYGDSKNAPYGTKTLEEVRKLTLADAEYLMTQNVKALVVACNTATSAAIHILREKYQKEIPVIGIEPALKPAVSVKENPRVLVMATPMTLREKKFHNLMQKVLGSGVAVFDGGAGTARETLHKLKEYSLVSDAVTPGTVQFYNSTEDQAMIELSKYLLEQRKM